MAGPRDAVRSGTRGPAAGGEARRRLVQERGRPRRSVGRERPRRLPALPLSRRGGLRQQTGPCRRRRSHAARAHPLLARDAHRPLPSLRPLAEARQAGDLARHPHRNRSQGRMGPVSSGARYRAAPHAGVRPLVPRSARSPASSRPRSSAPTARSPRPQATTRRPGTSTARPASFPPSPSTRPRKTRGWP